MTDSLKIFGYFRGAGGYDRLTRAFVRQLVKAGVRVELIQMPGKFSLPLPGYDSAFFEGLHAPVGAETTLVIAPPGMSNSLRNKCNVNYTMSEFSRIRPSWAERAQLQDVVVVPTESSRRAWTKGGVPEEKMRVSRLGVDAGFFSQSVAPLKLTDTAGRPLATYQVRILNVAQLSVRKNQLGLLKVWLGATRAEDDAVLILRASAGYGSSWADFYADLRDMLADTGLSFEQGAPVCFISEVMTDEQLRALYQTCTHYISFSRGEGWDLPMMEAAVSGLRLIAPAHSAYIEYLDSTSAHLLPATVARAACTGRAGAKVRAFLEGLSWWEPDEDAAVDLLSRVARSEEEVRPSPAARIARRYSWEQAAGSLLGVLAGCG